MGVDGSSPAGPSGDASAAAIAELSERLRADPADADGWLELGLAYAGIAHWAEAAGALARSVSFASERALGRLALGRALAELGRHDEAARELEHAVRLAPDEPRAHKELGLARYRLGRHDEAAEALGRATHLAPADARAHFALGLVHEARRDMGAAIASYRAAVAAEPRFGAARKTLADALAQMGELAAAADELRAVLGLERTNEQVALNLELCLRALGDMQKERLLGKPEGAVAASVLVTEGGFARQGVVAVGPDEAVRFTAKLAELWLTFGAAPAGAPPAARPVTRLLLVLTAPARAGLVYRSSLRKQLVGAKQRPMVGQQRVVALVAALLRNGDTVAQLAATGRHFPGDSVALAVDTAVAADAGECCRRHRETQPPETVVRLDDPDRGCGSRLVGLDVQMKLCLIGRDGRCGSDAAGEHEQRSEYLAAHGQRCACTAGERMISAARRPGFTHQVAGPDSVMNCWSSRAMSLHAADCVRAISGTGMMSAGIIEVPWTSALTLPTSALCRRSQTAASYDASSSHQVMPKQPPPPGPTAQLRLPPPLVCSVAPFSQTI
ncbi:MAG: tetratricopeptide repeat protein [Myxococcales bacterium]|nr:tetratricopeptide repeat protein [Myxococcales bacterium]